MGRECRKVSSSLNDHLVTKVDLFAKINIVYFLSLRVNCYGRLYPKHICKEFIFSNCFLYAFFTGYMGILHKVVEL